MSDAATEAPPPPVWADWSEDQWAYATAVAEALEALDGVTARLARWQEDGDALYAERLRLYLLLRDAKVPHRQIAAHTDASPEAVRVAIFKADNPGRPSRPPRKAT